MDLEALCQQREEYMTQQLTALFTQMLITTRYVHHLYSLCSITDFSVICCVQRTAATTQAAEGDGSGTEEEGIAKQLCTGQLYHDMNYWG